MYDIEYLDIPPLRSAQGTVHLPGSKSISNRVLLLCALSAGHTDVVGLLQCDDTQVMLDALTQLGCRIERQPDAALRVYGLGGNLPVRRAKLFLGNAGTAMRPLVAALSVLAAQHGGAFELGGVARMHERPIADLVQALRQMGCAIEYLQNSGYPPLSLGNGSLQTLNLQAPIRVRGDVSSQFLTALLMALPLLAAKQDIEIEIVGALISGPYVEITLNLLKKFGIHVQRPASHRLVIPAGSAYASPGRIEVEADASSASYFIALGAIAPAPPGSPGLTIAGIGMDSIQGDIRFVEAARLMGADVRSEGQTLHVRRGAWPLRAIDLDCNHIPDAAMTLAVMALYAQGTTTLRNIASWRVKETDRIAAVAAECRKLGAQVEEGHDFIRITPPASAQDWRWATMETYDDHRMAMCFALAAFNPAQLPMRIAQPRCVAKTFPDYFETLWSLCQSAPEHIPVICIDGPTASGKGTLSAAIAAKLGYHLLDSGALYRLLSLVAQRAGIAPDLADPQPIDTAVAQRLADLARSLEVRFSAQRIWLGQEDVTQALRTEAIGMTAARISALPQVRTALLDLQRSFCQLPGLVADGRDMGTVIFPHAPLKIYLTASAAQRAQRRHEQLAQRGITANIARLLADMLARDEQDSSRAHAPLKPAEDALLLDNSHLSVEQSVQQVLGWWQSKTMRSSH